MRLLRAGAAMWIAAVLTLLLAMQATSLTAQGQTGVTGVPTFHSTSTLVFLDVTVLDKQGRPVVTGLTKDDFTITEDKRPERIFSFEAPETHTMGADAGDKNPEGKAPVTIFVLDLLNSNFEDFAFIRYSVRKYLETQPALLKAPAEMMVVGNRTLELLQGYTRNKADLLFALNHLPTALPYKMMNASFFDERFGQSIDALQQIALQNKGVPGRKNIVWVGHGGPNVSTIGMPASTEEHLNRVVHSTTDMLVDARISLFVIYPGLKVQEYRTGNAHISALDASTEIGDSDPFAGDVNFGVFVNETGGNLFYNRNDVDAEMRRSQQLGSEYYTLTYQPQDGDANGRFRRIRVTLRDKNLHALTKAGYFAPDEGGPVDRRRNVVVNLSEAVRSTIPFTALDMKIANVVRHPDSRSVEFTVLLKERNLGWQESDSGERAASLIVAAASLSGGREVLASKLEQVALTTEAKNPVQQADKLVGVRLTLRVPGRTEGVRVVIGTDDGARLGAADLDRKTIDAAPEAPTSEPQLTPTRQGQGPRTAATDL